MTVAEVFLWGTKIGTVAFDADNWMGSFEYDHNFIRSGIELSPITMPLSRRIYTFPELARSSFHGLPGLLADSLPDKFGNAVIDSWLSSQGRDPDSFNPVERLCYTGNRGMGALEYVPARGPKSSEADSIEIDRLVRLASDILCSREELHVSIGENAMQDIIKVGTSAGGARAKAVIAWNERTGDIRSGQIDAGKGYGYWLIKFDGVSRNRDKEDYDSPQYTKIEYAYYLMAKDAGLIMSECRLYEENGRAHFMTKRFDRDAESGGKFHMQSLGAIAHFDFNQPGAYSYEQAAQVMRKLRITNKDISQFFRRMVFNVFSCNNDDHVKNVSFLMNKAGLWSLSPAYDVTYAYKPEGLWTGSHQMSINGKRSFIRIDDLLASAIHMGIKNGEAEDIISEVESSVSKWSSFAAAAKLSGNVYEKIEKQLWNAGGNR